MDNPVVLQGLGVILVLFFIFTMVMSAKNWKWFNIFIAFCVFGAAIYFLIEATMVLKNQKTWREIVNNYNRQLEPELKTKEALVYGNKDNADDPLGTLPKAIAEVQRVLMGRGRVWKGCTPDSVTDTSLKLTTPQSAPPPAPPMAPAAAPPPMPDPAAAPPADPNAPPADPNAAAAAPPVDPNAAPMPMPEAPAVPAGLQVRPNGIREKSILYVFTENKLNEFLTVPFVYVGEWSATEVTDTSVALVPLIPLDDHQKQALTTATTFTIYEMLPVDSMPAFDEFFAQAKVERTAEQLQAMIPKLPLADPKLQAAFDKSYGDLIQRYVRDGKAATPDDLLDTVWIQVKFKKTHEVPVDSTAGGAVPKDSPFFDANGLAILHKLRNGEAKKFKLGETAVFNQADAKKLIGDDICEEVGQVYRRPLNDYKHHFHAIYNRIDHMNNRIAEVNRQHQSIKVATDKVDKIVEEMKDSKIKLTDDKKYFLGELKIITAYSQKLEAARDASRARAKALYLSNLALAQQIAARQKELTDDINRKTMEATAAANR